jgi:hypothetical protein
MFHLALLLILTESNVFGAFNSTYKENVVCYKITCKDDSDTCAYTDKDTVMYLDSTV